MGYATASASNAQRAPAPARCVAGLATRGRSELLALVVDLLRRQTRPPDLILIAYVEPADIAGLSAAADLVLIPSAAGLTRQRNAILDRLPTRCEFVAFFDDDFLPHPQWLEQAVAAFDAAPELICVTGRLLANGVSRGEIAAPAGLALLAQAAAAKPSVEEGVSPYGCNMAFRRAAIGALRFDESLPLYGWLEDRDFAARVARGGGRCVRLGAAQGVHLGAGAGRMSDRRLGYAQIANPLHLLQRRTMPPAHFALRVLTDFASNLVKAPRSAARRRRLWGNGVALAEALVGRCAPERATRL